MKKVTRMANSHRTVRRITSVLFAAVLTLAPLSVAGPASAVTSAHVAAMAAKPLTTYDRIPANGRSWYYSAGNRDGSFVPAARVRQQGGEKSWGIRWVKGGGVTVRAAISDLVADGNRPFLVVSYDYGNGGSFATAYLTTDGREPSYSDPASVTFPWITGVSRWRSQSVLLTVCNGRDDAGFPTDCGTPHGPFHAD